jgi:lysophospholipase L1-like esterase
MRLILAAFILGVAVADAGERKDAPPIRYVAIGDSYSIGEGASPGEAWPAVLTRHLKEKGLKIELVANPSVTGWTTQQAIDLELPVFIKAQPNFATLLIGVNDWVQGVDEETFRKRIELLIERMSEVVPGRNRLLIITIPDFGVTPAGSQYARGRNISEGLTRFNRIIVEEAGKRHLPVVDIFKLSQKMRDDPALVAQDGLHPSAQEYAEWEKIIFPVAWKLLAK